MNTRRRIALMLMGMVSWQLLPAPSAGAAETVNFNRDIRPILSDNCFACHGPDKAKRDSDLRLDTPEGAFAKLNDHFAILPAHPDQSSLVKRITSSDADEKMPPAKSGKKLSEKQIELLTRWIEQGAKWQEHWAYQKPARSAVPQPKEAAGLRNPIDNFIRAKLAEQSLAPVGEADKRTLARRLHFDLIGLPPTPAEAAEFAAGGDDGYEKLVDRLLASPHFGERMALYWLDLVRFADTAGYHSDNHRDVWLYRDYVIQAFNDNKPFDRFTTEQLAGDLLSDANEQTKIASGYNRLLMTTEEGGAQAKEYTAKYAADRVRNVSSVWLASTMGCCECHDHKFDPFKTRNFYSLAAFFADVKETAVGRQEQTSMPTAAQAAQLKQLDEQIAALRKSLDAQTAELDAAQRKWEETARTQAVTWDVLKPASAVSKQGASLKILDDGTIVAGGKAIVNDSYTITAPFDKSGVTAFRLEALADASLPVKGPGRARNGNFVLSELQVAAVAKAAPDQVKPLGLQNASADFSQSSYDVALAIDGNPLTGWAVSPQFGKDHAAVFETKENFDAGDTMLTFTLDFNYGDGHALGKLRLAATTTARPVRAGGGFTPEVLSILALDAAQRSPRQQQALAAYYRGIAPELQAVRGQIGAVEKQKAELTKSFATTLISMSVQPRVVRILPRGNWLDDSGEIVEPAVPAFIAPLDVKDRRATRLDLANWLVSRDNPVVARVFVNRVWKLMFGQGLVKSLEDFGAQGAAPTHPQLLDWLAVDFVENGWDVKRLIKQMVMSGTYRQLSVAGKQLHESDPYNKWLARQGRFRLDAELVRDNALAISGLLVRKVGGPSVKPYQPAGYWDYLNFPTRVYMHDKGENQYRRGLYTYWQRTFMHPSLAAFDAPSREECTVDRTRSCTPPQALVLLNDPTYVESARVLAARIMKEGGATPADQLQWAYRQALAREPNPREAEALKQLYEKHLAEYTADKDSAAKLVSAGEAPAPADLNDAALAAWTSVARVLLNLHETVTRD